VDARARADLGSEQRLLDVVAVTANDVWIAGEAYVGANIEGFVQRWNGSSWTTLANAPTQFHASFFASSSSDLWLGRQHWDGAVWTAEPVAGCDPFAAAGALGGGAGRLFAVGAKQLPGRVPYVIERAPNCVDGAYCTSATTSNGCTPAMTAQGTASASASSGFVLRVDSVEGQRTGLIFYSINGQIALPWAPGSSSFLCVKSPTQRMGSGSSGGTSGQCDGVLASDWNAYMATNLGALGQPRSAGQTFDAQAWFRDPPAPKTTNLSNAYHFTLAP